MALLTLIKSHQIRIIHPKMKVNHNYNNISSIFIELQNIPHHHIDQQLEPKAEVNLELFQRILLHVNGNVSCKIRFWIFACGGNKDQWVNVSLTAEPRTPAKIGAEQRQKVYFSKIAGFGMFYVLYISLCKNNI